MYPQAKNYSKFPYKLMLPQEAEAYEKALAAWHCRRYADWRVADGFEVIATMLAEYAVDSMHEDDGLPESIFDWLDDDIHWIWDIAMQVQNEFEEAARHGSCC